MLAAAMGLAGCSAMVSLQPFVSEQYATFDPALTGVWADKDDGLYLIKQDGKGYNIRSVNKNGALTYSAQLYKNGDLWLLDLVSSNDDPFQLAVHTPVRVWVEGNTLKFAWLDSSWLKEKARKQLAVEDVGDRALITAPGDKVLAFLLTYGAAGDAYGTPEEWHRL
jgi:hypothetical protein